MRTVTLMKEARFAKQGENMATVALPHTWNNFDGQDGRNDYWRGIGTYEIDLLNPTAGKKQYIVTDVNLEHTKVVSLHSVLI